MAGSERPQRRCLYVDFSNFHTVEGGEMVVGGIWRLVLQVVERLAECSPTDVELKFVHYRPSDGQFYKLDPAFFHRGEPYSVAEVERKLGPLPPRPLNREKYRGRPIRGIYRRADYALKRGLYKLRSRRRGGTALGASITFRTGDRYLYMGPGWEAPELMMALECEARRGLEPVFVIYDLIPLVVPTDYSSMHAGLFRKWLNYIASFASRYIAISENTRRDLLAYLTEAGLPVPPIDVTPLAHEFSAPHAQPIRPEIQAVGHSDYVLYVGSLAGRKNGLKLIEVWDRLSHELEEKAVPKLVLAGNQKRAGELLRQAIGNSSQLARKIVVVDRPNDAELAELYRNCLFTVFPSAYEGWGLPVGESLWFGKLCVASKTSAIPEVGGDLVDYIDPEDLDSMYAGIRRPIVDELYWQSRRDGLATAAAGLRKWKRTAEAIAVGAVS